MKKIQFLAMILFFMLGSLMYSQSSFRVVDSSPKSSFTKTSSGFYRMTETKQKIKREYYYKDFSNKAIIFDANKKKYVINNFNIDLIDNCFVSRINNDSLFVFSTIDKARIGRKEFIRDNSNIYETLVKGKRLNLSLRFLSYKKEEVIDKLNGKVIRPAHFKIKKEYLIKDKIKGKVLNLKKIKKKSILKHIDKNLKKDVESYAQKNNFSFRKEKDVKKILNYYNSL